MNWRQLAGAALERGLHHPLRVVPSDAGSTLGAWLGRRVVPALYPAAAARARATLVRLRPDLDPEAAVAEALANIAATYAEIPRILRFWEEGRVAVKGTEHLLAPRRAGRPVICAALHTGNPEVLGLTLAKLGARPVGVAARQPTVFRDRVIRDIRIRGGGRLIVADSHAMRPAIGVLRADPPLETLLFWMDEHVGGGAVRGPSLGRGTLPASGNMALAARLARLTGAALVPGHVTRLAGPARFLTTFLPEVALPAAADRAADAAAIDRVVDPVVRALLPQWLHVFDLRGEAPPAEAPDRLTPPRSPPP